MVLRQLNTMNDGEIVKEGHLKRLKVGNLFIKMSNLTSIPAIIDDIDA